MDLLLAQRHLDGLITFLAVARLGRYTAAAEVLSVNHSTVSRRIAALEKTVGTPLLARAPGGWEVTPAGQRAVDTAERVEAALAEFSGGRGTAELSGVLRIGAPDALATWVVTPAMSGLQAAYPDIAVEILSVTQRVRQNRSGLDLEIVVGEPEVRRAATSKLMDYALNLYASRTYLDTHAEPATVEDLGSHPLNYYVESMLSIDALDQATEQLPRMRRGVASTNVHAHVAATRVGAGIGLLPDFVARQDPQLVRVLAEDFTFRASYWTVVRQEGLRSHVVQEGLATLRGYVAELGSAAP